GHRRAVPFEQRRYRESGGLARLRRPERDQRVAVLGPQQSAALSPEREPASSRATTSATKRPQVVPPSPPGATGPATRDAGAASKLYRQPPGGAEQAERRVEPRRTRESGARGRRPRPSRVAEPRGQPRQHPEHLPGTGPRPAASEQGSGDAAPQPDEPAYSDHHADPNQHRHVGWAISPHRSRMPVS